MSVVLCEFELSQAQNTAADLSVILPPENYSLQPRVVVQANELLKSPGSRMPVLFTPRVWAALTPEERAQPRAIPVTYVIKHEELEALGADFGWGRRLEETARPRRGRSTA